MDWATFTSSSTTLARGDVVNLRRKTTGDTGTMHWCTSLGAGQANSVQTYAGDSSSRVFRYETVEDYYCFYYNYYELGDPGEFETWLQDKAALKIYRKPE